MDYIKYFIIRIHSNQAIVLDILHGRYSMNFGDAKNFCRENDMMLPLPKNERQSHQLMKFGPTWLDISVNAILGFSSYFDSD